MRPAAAKLDMDKVKAAVRRLLNQPEPAPISKPSSRIPQDAAIRKPLRNRGVVCRGWEHRNFLH